MWFVWVFFWFNFLSFKHLGTDFFFPHFHLIKQMLVLLNSVICAVSQFYLNFTPFFRTHIL